MTKFDFRLRLKNKLDKDGDWVSRFLLPGIGFLVFINLFSYVYLNVYKIEESTFIYLLSFYFGFFVVVFITFKSFLNRLYAQKERRFLYAHSRILHPLVSLLVLTFFILLKSTFAGFDLAWDLLIGCWMIFTSFFAFYATYLWSRSFRKGKPLFQIVWIPRVALKEIKLYILTFLLIITGLLASILLMGYFLETLLLQKIVHLENFFKVYPGIILTQFMVLFLALIPTIFVLSTNKTIKYSKMCLELVKERLRKKVGQKTFTSTEEFTHIFPDVIDNVNNWLNLLHAQAGATLYFSASHPPRILNKDHYSKQLLIADIIKDNQHLDKKDKQRLMDVRNGLDKLIRSLDIKGDGFFYPFIEGLTQIVNSGEMDPPSCIEDAFELKPRSFTEKLKKYHWLIEFFTALLLGVLAVFGLIF